MSKTILLTSFATWLSHQRSNSSDDLLQALLKTHSSSSLHVLRQLPVDFDLAPQQTIARVKQLQPDLIVCCGMAEGRTKLSLESRAVANEVLSPNVDLERLVAGLPHTEISHDAGRFVCNWLYHTVLKQVQGTEQDCLFVHVPVLTAANLQPIAADFRCIVDRILQADQAFPAASA
jgi:pyroglutamyl-peptidase